MHTKSKFGIRITQACYLHANSCKSITFEICVPTVNRWFLDHDHFVILYNIAEAGLY